MSSIVTEVGLVPGTRSAKERLDNWQTVLFTNAQMMELTDPVAAHCQKAMSMLCSQLGDLVNSDALLSDVQLQSLHPLLKTVAQQFLATGYSLEQVREYSSFGLLTLATYINSCRG